MSIPPIRHALDVSAALVANAQRRELVQSILDRVPHGSATVHEWHPDGSGLSVHVERPSEHAGA